jgi:hypothetical protein
MKKVCIYISFCLIFISFKSKNQVINFDWSVKILPTKSCEKNTVYYYVNDSTLNCNLTFKNIDSLNYWFLMPINAELITFKNIRTTNTSMYFNLPIVNEDFKYEFVFYRDYKKNILSSNGSCRGYDYAEFYFKRKSDGKIFKSTRFGAADLRKIHTFQNHYLLTEYHKDGFVYF